MLLKSQSLGGEPVSKKPSPPVIVAASPPTQDYKIPSVVTYLSVSPSLGSENSAGASKGR